MNNNDEIVKKGIEAFASVLADAYIKKSALEPIEEFCKKDNVEYKPGKLYSGHIKALQMLLIEETGKLGLTLAELVEKTGEKFEMGKLSKFENDIVVQKALIVGAMTDIILELTENK